MQVTKVHVNPETSLKALIGNYHGTRIETCGAGNHVGKAERAIREIKDHVRVALNQLPFKTPKQLIPDAVKFAVIRINMEATRDGEVPPRIKMTGLKPRMDKEYACKFGDVVEVYNPKSKSNTMEPRSQTCIVCYPAGNATGSIICFDIVTKRRVTRSNWTPIKTTQLIIDAINRIHPDELISINVEEEQEQEVLSNAFEEETKNSTESNDPIAEVLQLCEQLGDLKTSDEEYQIFSTEMDKQLLEAEVEDNAIKVMDPQPAIKVNQTIEAPKWESTGRPKRSEKAMKIPSRFQTLPVNKKGKILLTFKQAIKKHGLTAAEAAVKTEMQQMIDECAFHPVHDSNGHPTLYSMMRITEKTNSQGKLIKLKGRHVANGATQVPQLYEDKTSPTIKQQHLTALYKIIVELGLITEVQDVKCAFLKAPMKGEVFMHINKEIADYYVELNPKAAEFLKPNGMLVKLDKAVYGCQQSGKLWNDTITQHLLLRGFTQHPKDPCVFTIMRNEVLLIVGIHVDDLLSASSSQEVLDWFTSQLKQEFKDIHTQQGNDQEYLGTRVQRTDNGDIQLSMDQLIADIIGDETETAATPANPNLMDVDETSPKLDERERRKMHTVVAQLLYAAIKFRPDLLFPTAFLTTRVAKATEQDKSKLSRIIKYLNLTKERKMLIPKTGSLELETFIDAGFATHSDGKSHTGLVITLGKTPIMVRSSKQHLVAKDSTEAELIGLSDKMPDTIDMCEFLQFFGIKLPTPVIYQDNQSSMILIGKTGKKHRNKYMLVRQELIKERIEKEDIRIEYCPTEVMLADIMTKSLQGNLFRKFRDQLLNSDIPDGGTSSDSSVQLRTLDVVLCPTVSTR